jgi:hypothetical protein
MKTTWYEYLKQDRERERCLGTISTKQIELEERGQENMQWITNAPLFITEDGDEIFAGDTVRIYTNDRITPQCGTISTISGELRADVFWQLSRKWKYYKIVDEESKQKG